MTTHYPSWELTPGDLVVPHCAVRRLLGGGQSYETYEAIDDRLLTPVVVKVVRPHLVRHEGVLSDLRREIALTERLRHPLIVRNLHHDAGGPRPYVALEKLPGRPLDQMLNEVNVLPVDQAVSLGLGIATVLHYLTTQSVVHLDVNTNNIVLHDRVPRLIDFDIARESKDAAGLTFSTGSPRCAAPEQFTPPTHGRAGHPTDVWGLGATLFRAVAGFFPFPLPRREPDASEEERFPQVWVPARDLPESVPAPLADAILRCLSKDPEERPTPLALVLELQTMAPHLGGTIRPNAGS